MNADFLLIVQGPSVTCAMTSGSMGRWLLKLLDLPAVAVFRICGLSSRFFRDEWRLIELRFPWLLTEHLSGPSLGRFWLMMGWEDGRQLAPTPGEEESVRELPSPWLSLRKAFLMLPDSGRFLCLQQTEMASDQEALGPRELGLWQRGRGWHLGHLKKVTQNTLLLQFFFLLFSLWIGSLQPPTWVKVKWILTWWLWALSSKHVRCCQKKIACSRESF